MPPLPVAAGPAGAAVHHAALAQKRHQAPVVVKIKHKTAGFGPCFHLPGFHVGTSFLSHSQVVVKAASPEFAPLFVSCFFWGPFVFH